MIENPLEQYRMHYLDVADLQSLFGVGRSKARLMMDALPSIRIGSKDYVLDIELQKYVQANDGIHVKWPKRHR